MDNSKSTSPVITDITECICRRCKKVCYMEEIVSRPNEYGSLSYERLVSGKFKQTCDKFGVPDGPIIPNCSCREDK